MPKKCLTIQICGVELGASRRRTARWSPFHQSLAWYREYLSGYLIVFFLTCVSKVLVGEPRPHFLDTCKPYQAMNCTSGSVKAVYFYALNLLCRIRWFLTVHVYKVNTVYLSTRLIVPWQFSSCAPVNWECVYAMWDPWPVRGIFLGHARY